jgi:hypothetical protein
MESHQVHPPPPPPPPPPITTTSFKHINQIKPIKFKENFNEMEFGASMKRCSLANA